MCRNNVQKRGFNKEISENKKGVRKTREECKIYNIFLCRKGDYVRRFHERSDFIIFIK